MPRTLERFAGRRVLVVGDLMVDEYLRGEVERISPEAPVQVVHVQQEESTLGGAANVVHNLAALGARVAVAAIAGQDRAGRLLARRLQRLGVDGEGLVTERGRPTTRKTRVVAGGQHVLRIDRESRQAIAGASLEGLQAFVSRRVPESDAVLISDYGKGVVVPPLVACAVRAAALRGVPVIVDPKGRDYGKYRGATLLTPNLQEAALAAGMELGDAARLAQAAERIREVAGVAHLLVTCGKEGMALFEAGAAMRRIGARARQVVDVSGAGDTVLALLGLGLGSGLSLVESAELAAVGAGVVVAKAGTAPLTLAELAAALDPAEGAPASKERSLEELAALAALLRRQGKKVVLTNGCFDLIHGGHIELLAAARRLGDALIVAIDDDPSVRRLKGPGRPVADARERIRILSAMDSVDHVVVFASHELERLLEALRPDVLTKGSNYSWEEVQGRETVERAGGRVVLVPITGETSASRIIDRIRGA
jgi:D-beta-D-heptose 7-phosphate kinase/D-beta-D-heptose 1-phosphate adenosyltransferase